MDQGDDIVITKFTMNDLMNIRNMDLNGGAISERNPNRNRISPSKIKIK